MNTEKLVVGLAGMPGAGKSLVVETAWKMGYGVVVMGDVIREETKKRGLSLNPENTGKVMLDMRKQGGANIVARKCISKIEQLESKKVIIDGLRSFSEVEVFRKEFPNFSLMAIYASPEKRFRRLYRRQRSDDPDSWELFHNRDMRELSVGLGDAIAMAGHLIINEKSKGKSKADVQKALRRIERKWNR